MKTNTYVLNHNIRKIGVEGDEVELTERQARYHVISGAMSPAKKTPAPKKAAKKPATKKG